MIKNSLCTVDEAINDIRLGKMLIVVDDENRENEGDLIFAADKVTPEHINFMATHARGLICMPITADRARKLDLEPMVENNTCKHGTAFTVSVDAKANTTTGISAFDRYETVKAIVDPTTVPTDFDRPGHIFPLIADAGGVLARPGHTEAVVDLAQLAGLSPAGVCCEILNADGSMARMADLEIIARDHGIKMISIKQLVDYRKETETLVERVETTRFPTQYGEFTLYVYRTANGGNNPVALVKGDVAGGKDVLTRVHSSCLTGDVLGSLRCDCGLQLQRAMTAISEAGNGVLLYLLQEGRGIGLANKIRAYALQDQGLDTVEANERLGFPADMRDYGVAARILEDLRVEGVRLMTNNPRKVAALQHLGVDVIERVPIQVEANENNMKYLATKKEKLGHLLEEPDKACG